MQLFNYNTNSYIQSPCIDAYPEQKVEVIRAYDVGNNLACRNNQSHYLRICKGIVAVLFNSNNWSYCNL